MTHIFIFHSGCQDYVRLCLNQCLKYGNNVVLLNDNPNNFKDLISDKCNIVDYRNYFTNANIFQKMYKHFSTNNLQLELICIIRWMCIYEYMKKHRIIRGFIIDSDVLVYDNIKDIDEKYLKDKELMLCSSSSKNLTGSASIFNFMKLREFIGFIFEFYSDENIKLIENWWKNYKEPGGICDMTLLYYFANGTKFKFGGLRLPEYPYFNQDLTSIFNNEFTFDLHLGTYGNHPYPEEWEKDESTQNKKIKFIENKPYCFNKRLNKDIRFILLHFQGRNKAIMNNYYNMG